MVISRFLDPMNISEVLPLKHADRELDNLETHLKDKEFHNALVSHLATIQGKDVREMTYNVMAALMTDEMAKNEVSFYGEKRYTIAFKDSILRHCVAESVMQRFDGTPRMEVFSSVKRWFLTAPLRCLSRNRQMNSNLFG